MTLLATESRDGTTKKQNLSRLHILTSAKHHVPRLHLQLPIHQIRDLLLVLSWSVADRGIHSKSESPTFDLFTYILFFALSIMDIFLCLVPTPCKTRPPRVCPLVPSLSFPDSHAYSLATGLSLLFRGPCFSIKLTAVVYTLAYAYVAHPSR